MGLIEKHEGYDEVGGAGEGSISPTHPRTEIVDPRVSERVGTFQYDVVGCKRLTNGEYELIYDKNGTTVSIHLLAYEVAEIIHQPNAFKIQITFKVYPGVGGVLFDPSSIRYTHK